MSVKKVRIRHEETNQESEVVESSVRAWQTVGWTLVEDEGSQTPASNGGEFQVTKAKNDGPAAPDTSKKE